MKKIFVCIFPLCLLSLLTFAQIPEKDPGAFRITAYNVGVFSKYTDDSTSEIADIMHEIGADAVAVCELDSCNRRHATFQLEQFAQALGGWNFRFGSAMQWAGGAYGTGVVTSAEIYEGFDIKLPEGDGYEPRVCVVAETKDYVLAAVHLDHSNDDVRLEQARIITDELQSRYGRSRKPVFLCGDLNAAPGSLTLKQLSEDWVILSEQAPTYPSDSPRECIDYILALKNHAEYTVTGTSVLTESKSADMAQMSDHLPVFVDVMVK